MALDTDLWMSLRPVPARQRGIPFRAAKNFFVLFAFPLQGLNLQSPVIFHPVVISVNCLSYLLDCCDEIILPSTDLIHWIFDISVGMLAVSVSRIRSVTSRLRFFTACAISLLQFSDLIESGADKE